MTLETCHNISLMILIVGAIATAIGTGGTVYFGKKISQSEKNALKKLDKEFSSEKEQSQEKISILEDTISRQSQEILSQEEKLKELQKEIYKPLKEDRQKKLIAGLKALRQEYSTISPSIRIRYEKGNSLRANIGSDLKKYLQEAEWNVDFGGRVTFDEVSHAFVFKFHSDDTLFAEKFYNIIAPLFINIDQFVISKSKKKSNVSLEVIIYGDPLFDDSGVVTFK
ncbi:MAG TPA: hypothetical protein HPP87_03270 [Planctomycetes bacterium]|nr:hypothetical protein [Planctomycetota bacterium]